MAIQLNYPKDLAGNTREYKHRISFSALKKNAKTPSTGGPPPAHGMVSLYLPPEALKTSYSQGWGDTDMGALGQQMLNSAAEGGGAAALKEGSLQGALTAMGKGEKGSAVKAIIGAATQAGAQSFRKYLSSGAIGGESAMRAVEKIRGEILNPHKAVMYTGPGGFRTFSYNFVMVGRNEDEAETIARIVKFFKYWMHPGLGVTETQGPSNSPFQTGGGAAPNIGSSLTLTYPAEWKIEIRVQKRQEQQMGWDSPTPILFKIDKCFLESCNVDYTSGGTPAFFKRSGQPQTTSLALQFKETTIMTREMIEKGY